MIDQIGMRMENNIKKIPGDLLFALLDNPYESLILIDREGVVRFMSSSNEGTYGMPAREAAGRHISEVSPGTGLPRVLETGKAEIGRSMILDDHNRVINRIPLVKDGRIIGAAGKLMLKNPQQLLQLYERIDTLEKQLDYYKDELHQLYGIRYSFDNIIGNSEKIIQAKVSARQAAMSDSPVIITGESGTGKELFAHAIHQASKRSRFNFVRVNCAAIPSDLIEAELFGYAPGAFTGARRRGRTGKFELAHNGTVFLDEIGDMPWAMQVKLMRVLQDKVVERIGGGKPRPIDFRVISATNRDLDDMMAHQTFRLDLYHRLNVITVKLPPLREIKEDIPVILHQCLEELCRVRKEKIKGVSPEAMEALIDYSWPGNVRELRNVVERALIVCDKDVLRVEDLTTAIRKNIGHAKTGGDSPSSLKDLLEETERLAILNALEKAGNNRVKAAGQLGIHRTGLYQKMKKYNIG
jgi:transcriptional regulator with PAS, ATPase and Fis domain